MFIVSLNDGQTLIEGVNCPNWDCVPQEGIKEVMLIVNEKPIILPKCELYFYSTEAVSQIGINTNVPLNPIITAHIIGGISGDKAIYIRAETNGITRIELKNKSELTYTEKTYKKG